MLRASQDAWVYCPESVLFLPITFLRIRILSDATIAFQAATSMEYSKIEEIEQADIASREGGALLLTPHARGGIPTPPEASPHARGGVPPPPETRGQTFRALDFTPHFAAFSRIKSSFLELHEP